MKPIDLKHHIGAVNEAKAQLYFVKEGWEIYIPRMTQSKCDFIAVKGSEVAKVQVKTASWCKTGPWSYCQTRLINRLGQLYAPEDYDLLFVVDDKHAYMIPHKYIYGRTSLYFATDNPSPRKSSRSYDPEDWKVTL